MARIGLLTLLASFVFAQEHRYGSAQSAEDVLAARDGMSEDTCDQDGAIVCNGQSHWGVCNWGKVSWQPVAEGTRCEDGSIKAGYPATSAQSQTSSASTPAQSCPPVQSCYNGGGPTATIDVGVVHGTTTSLPAASATVNKFLGVPFAKSPPTRFAPPELASTVTNPINATAFKPACVQQFEGTDLVREFTKFTFNNPGGPPPEESEDCLYLNVYSPSTPAPCDGRPVLLWIYGGNLQFGTAGQNYYDGSAFASYEDVIVVTIDYRTNVFGFATTPELPIAEQNLGFLDQRFALEWVQRNIKAFGGSPDKVTLFGESAGGFSIDALLTSSSKDVKPPFRGAILQSGQISYNPQPRPSTVESWAKLAAALNCSSSQSNLTCIRAANATTIKSIIETDSLTFDPTYDNVTFYANAAQRRVRGEVANIPVLVGSNSQEGRIFNVAQNDSRPFLETITANTTTLLNAINDAYPLTAPDSGPTPYDQLSQIFTEYVFQCTAALMANASVAAGIPTWRYYFNASFANTQPVPQIAALGAYHSSEIPLVFGTFGPVNVTTQQYALSNAIRGMWARFARYPVGGPGWNQVGTGSEGEVLAGTTGITNVVTVLDGIVIGGNGTEHNGTFNVAVLGNRHNTVTTLSVVDSEELDYRCGLFAPIYAAIAAMDSQNAIQQAEQAQS